MSIEEYHPGPDSRTSYRIHKCDVRGCESADRTFGPSHLGLPEGWYELTVGVGLSHATYQAASIDVCPLCWSNPVGRVKAHAKLYQTWSASQKEASKP